MGVTTQVLRPQDVTMNVMRPHHKFTNLPQSLVESAQVSQKEKFDAKKHLNFERPERIYTTEELGLGQCGISPNAFSDPFPLFSKEAIRQMRGEIFDQDVLDKYHCQTGPSTGQVRGHCPKDAPFITEAWNSKEVLRIVSEIAGVELVPALSYDTGHCNISVNGRGTENDTAVAPGEEKSENKEGYCESAFGWHTDSYPFVVVTMLSDCTGMVGGETRIRTGDGRPMAARGPQMGTAVVMQGRYVEHQATAALGGQERISMVTSFRPKSPSMVDGTILRGVRNISHLPTLYQQYAEYRLENLEERFRNEQTLIRKRRVGADGFDTAQVRAFLLEQRSYLDDMLSQLTE